MHFKWLLITVLLACASGATAKVVFAGWSNVTSSRSTEVWGYDPSNGTEEENILRNFNIHRGRWWNYFERGSWYLAYNHYKAAERDFREVLRKRPTDKRDCRTYGMHFRDCFANRELGITLYYLALQNRLKTHRLFELEKSIKYLEESLTQVKSSRAAFFLNLAKERLWKDKDEDNTAPVITVENAIRSGENWAVVFPNLFAVQLDILVTDGQSGVSKIWVNKKELFVECSGPEISKKVHIPISAEHRWIMVNAMDLANNNSPPFLVKVESDVNSPLIFKTIDQEQIIYDGLTAVEYSDHKDLGLNTIQIDDQKTGYNSQNKHSIAIQIKAESVKSGMELRATDLTSHNTKNFVDSLSKNDHTKQHMNTRSRFAWLTYLNKWRWSTCIWPQAFPFFFRDIEFHPAVYTLAYDMKNNYLERESQVELMMCAETPLIISQKPFPSFKSENYKEVYSGSLLKSTRYELHKKPNHFSGVTGAEVGDIINVEQHYDENAFSSFSKIVPLLNYVGRKVEVKALYAGRTAVPHTTLYTSPIVQNPVTEPNSLYSVIVLPLIPCPTPYNTQPEGPYPSLWDAVANCKILDPNCGNFLRFDCRKMQGLDRNTLKTNLVDPSSVDVRRIVSRLGLAHGVDLGICGFIREYNEYMEIEIYVEDIENNCLLAVDPNKNPIDTHRLKGKEKEKFDLNPLMVKLKDSIPLVYGEVKEIKRKMMVEIIAGKRKGIFPNQKLCFFEKEKVPSKNKLCNQVAKATVKRPGEGRSVVKVKPTDRGENPLLGFKEDQLFIRTK